MFYINCLANGGAERAICNTASYFAEHDWATFLLTSFRMKDEYHYSEKVIRLSIEEGEVVQSRIARNVSRICIIRKICKEKNIDVLVSFMREPNIRALIATIGIATKNVISVRSDPKKEYVGFAGKIVAKYLLPHADGAVFQTQEARGWFDLKLQKKSKVIYNIVDNRFFDAEYYGDGYIISVGRIMPVKNHAMLIRAFQKVHEEFPEERLYIYGSNENDAQIRSLIEQLNLTECVFLPGKCTNVEEVLSRAKLFVLSSNQEGMPNALMEAMAVGVPSSSTDCPCGGPRELFGEDLKDMLVPVENSDFLAEKMIAIVSDKKTRLKLGLQMKNRAERFRTEIIGQEWMEYVTNVCEKE